MCGIAGTLTPRGEIERIGARIGAMTGALGHRGPDGQATWCAADGDHALAFGHTRLSILDLSASADQPMIDPASGCVMVFNGEIYNYLELREALLQAGERPFTSTGDSEVLLRAYARWGLDAIPRLRGMFALAIYDPRHKRLFLARDHLGIKPLYFTANGGIQGRFAFASEVRALLRLEEITRRLSPLGLAGFLAYGSVQNPLTLIDGIEALPPGHWMAVDLAGPAPVIAAPTAFYHLPLPESSANRPLAELAAEVQHTLRESVRLHLASDVPLGAFLSGGIDSASVVALMSEAAPDHVHTLTVAFEEADYSEAEIARAVASRYRTQHTEIRMTAQSFLKDVPAWLASFDQPSADGANTWVISRACRAAGIIVALSGLGGDELFAGYPTFFRTARARGLYQYFGWLPRILRQTGALALNQIKSTAAEKLSAWMAGDGAPSETYLVTRAMCLPETIRDVLDARFLRSAPRSALPPSVEAALRSYDRLPDVIAAVSLFEANTYLVSTLLRDSDQMGMAHSIEIRVPFVDWVVADMALRIPGVLRLAGRGSKPLLKAAMNGRLDPAWTERPKMGFAFPFDVWLRGELRAEVERGLARLAGYPFQPGAIQTLWARFQAGKINAGRILALYALSAWLEQHGVTA